MVYVGEIDEGKQLVSVDYQGGVYVWDAKTLRQVSTKRKAPFPVKTAALLDTHSLLVAGSAPQDFFAIIELTENRPPRMIGAAGGETTSISSRMGNGLRAVVATESHVRILDIDKNGAIHEFLKIAKIGVSSISLSDDGNYLAIATTESKLLLVDANSGTALWERDVDRPLTSLSVSTKADVIVGGYENVLASTLKRIDQFDLGTGRTMRQIPTDPCSVFQVNIVDDTRGFAICGPAITDSLVNMNKHIRTSFLTWTIQSDNEAVTAVTPPQARPGALGYLPFRAGVMFDRESTTLFIGGGDGSLFSARLKTKERDASIERLAPIPQVALRFAIASEPHRLLVVSNPIGRNGGADSNKVISRKTMRSAIRAAAAKENFTEAELEDAIYAEDTMLSLIPPNDIASWDIDSGASNGSMSTPLGYFLDAAPEAGEHKTQTLVVEAVTAPVSGEFEPTILAVSHLTSEYDFELLNRRLVSIDSVSGLLKDGIRRGHEGRNRFNLSVCPSATVPGNVRVSADGQLLCVACLVLHEDAPPESQDFLHPDYDLLTYWLNPLSKGIPARIRFPGAPTHLEISRDGSVAAVVTHTQSFNKDSATPSIETMYALTIIDTKSAKVLRTISPIAEPATGKAMQFSPDSKFLYAALGRGVYQYDVDADVLIPIKLPNAQESSSDISAMTINHDASLMAVARYNEVTEVYRLMDLTRIGILRHPGETMLQIEFDGPADERILSAAMSGGIGMFDYRRGGKLVDFLSYVSGEWITVAPDGVFSASIGGELGVTATDGRRAVGVDKLYDLYFRPETLRRRVGGESAEGPAPEAVRHALEAPAPSVEVTIAPDASNGVIASIAIHDSGGGIGGLRAFHNGKLSDDLDAIALLKRASNAPEVRTLRIDIPLPIAAGSNDYVIAALNADRSAQSRFAKVSFNHPSDSLAKPKAYILLIGTNFFEQSKFPKLSLAEESSRQLGESFRNVLANAVGAQNVEVLDLVGEESRFASVERALIELEKRVTANDIIALILTTHGIVLPSGEMLAVLRDTGADDARALTTTSLIGSMNKIRALTQILVLDICHAGVVSDRVSAIYQDRFAVFASRAGIHVLASTSAEEPALAAFNGTTPFAHFLIEGLQPRPAPTMGMRSLRSVASVAKEKVKATAARFGFIQVPTIYSFGRDFRFP